jgi:cytochrome b subunit of formate dehydrogenase
MGGQAVASRLHRLGALITIFYFIVHVLNVIWHYIRQLPHFKDPATGKFSFIRALKYTIGPDSPMPNAQDFKDMVNHNKWFLGLGEKPQFDRWTYWEKFDYLAVFWGVAIIGSTGLTLWFPELFTYVLPGWFINVATIIHSDEALLATGFIFTIHFFNTHFRPDRFPMDPVIFTGRVPVEELKEDRPREYEALLESGELERNLVDPLPSYVVRGFKIFGAVALTIGLGLILLIVWAEVFGYR